MFGDRGSLRLSEPVVITVGVVSFDYWTASGSCDFVEANGRCNADHQKVADLQAGSRS
jgi:hypothetical protein